MESSTNEIVKLFRERLKYPIITIYSIIVIIYNWDVISTFFLSDMPIEKRVIYIRSTYAGQSTERILIPLWKAFLASMAAPIVMWVLDLLLMFTNQGRQNMRNHRIQNDLENKKENAILEWDIAEAKTGKKNIDEWQEKIIQKDAIISELKTSLQERIDVLSDSSESQKNVIDNQRSIINDLKNELSIAKRTSDLDVEKQVTKNHFIDLFIDITVSALNVTAEELKTILHFLVENTQTTSGKFSRFIGDHVDPSETKQNFILSFLVNRKFIEFNKTTDVYKLLPLGYNLYLVLPEE